MRLKQIKEKIIKELKDEYYYWQNRFYYSIKMKYFCIPMWKLQLMVWNQKLNNIYKKFF